jgi:hypothetical protein
VFSLRGSGLNFFHYAYYEGLFTGEEIVENIAGGDMLDNPAA